LEKCTLNSKKPNIDNKCINLYWCYYGNLGDALNPYIVSGLSGLGVKYSTSENPNYLYELYLLCRSNIKYDFNRLKPYNPSKKIIMAIGSILDRAHPNFLVWGSGYMNEFQHSEGGKFFAVRGALSARKLFQDGFPYCSVWGDPALLLPLLYKPDCSKKYLVGIIPHHSDSRSWLDKYKNKAEIIQVMTSRKQSIENVIDNICSCEYILSSSLHGLIVAHSYHIPAIWVRENNIVGTFKFYDYFSSVGIRQYTGFTNVCKILDNPKEFFYSNGEKFGIMNKLDNIQRDLLNAAPFNILDKFRAD
jgi:hypothetical protein